MIERDSFLDWSVEIRRKPRRRGITIQLKPHSPIIVLASRGTSLGEIRQFLQEKKDWISKGKEKLRDLEASSPEPFLRTGNSFPFLGRNLNFKATITPLKKAFMSRTEEHLVLHIPANDWSANTQLEDHTIYHNLMRDFYKREAIRYLEHRVNQISHQTQLRPRELRFREQKTRWGSCSSRGSINLNWRLIVFSPEIIDYVIIHELCHLIEMNHSSRYWSLVEQFMPDYRQWKRKLSDSTLTPQFLTRLLAF